MPEPIPNSGEGFGLEHLIAGAQQEFLNHGRSWPNEGSLQEELMRRFPPHALYHEFTQEDYHLSITEGLIPEELVEITLVPYSYTPKKRDKPTMYSHRGARICRSHRITPDQPTFFGFPLPLQEIVYTNNIDYSIYREHPDSNGDALRGKSTTNSVILNIADNLDFGFPIRYGVAHMSFSVTESTTGEKDCFKGSLTLEPPIGNGEVLEFVVKDGENKISFTIKEMPSAAEEYLEVCSFAIENSQYLTNVDNAVAEKFNDVFQTLNQHLPGFSLDLNNISGMDIFGVTDSILMEGITQLRLKQFMRRANDSAVKAYTDRIKEVRGEADIPDYLSSLHQKREKYIRLQKEMWFQSISKENYQKLQDLERYIKGDAVCEGKILTPAQVISIMEALQGRLCPGTLLYERVLEFVDMTKPFSEEDALNEAISSFVETCTGNFRKNLERILLYHSDRLTTKELNTIMTIFEQGDASDKDWETLYCFLARRAQSKFEQYRVETQTLDEELRSYVRNVITKLEKTEDV